MRPRTLPTFSRNDCKLASPSSRPTLTQRSEEPWTRSSTRVRTRCWLDNAAGTGVSKDLDISRNQNGVGQHDVSHKSFPTMVERWWFIGWCMALHCCDAHQHMWDHSRKPYVKFKVNEITTSLPGVKKNANPGRWLRPSGSCDKQQAQGRDGQELVAAEVQVDTLNPELDERNYQCEVLFRRIGALEIERERIHLLETGRPKRRAGSQYVVCPLSHCWVSLFRCWIPISPLKPCNFMAMVPKKMDASYSRITQNTWKV